MLKWIRQGFFDLHFTPESEDSVDPALLPLTELDGLWLFWAGCGTLTKEGSGPINSLVHGICGCRSGGNGRRAGLRIQWL